MSSAVGSSGVRHHRWASRLAAGLVALSVAGGANAQAPGAQAPGDRAKSSEKARSDKSKGKGKGKSSSKGKGKGADKDKERPEVKVSENANRRFSQGVRYLTSQDPGRYEKAYREFKAAYADSPSWKILGNLGIVAQELERDGEAIDAIEAYLDQSGKDLSAEERKQFKEDLEVLRAGYSTVTIETVPDGAWIVDERLPETGEPIVNRYGPTSGKLELRVRAGHHRMVAELSGYEGVAWEFSDAPGGASTHRFELHPPRPVVQEAPVEPPVEAKPTDLGVDSSPGSPALRVTAYVALGLGAVGVGLGTYFLLDGYDKRDKADGLFADCEAQVPGCAPGAPLRGDAQDAEDAESSAFQRSMLTFAAGGALAATGVVLLLVSSGSDEGPARDAALTPWIGPDWVGVSGRF
jgi:hypothetical protein